MTSQQFEESLDKLISGLDQSFDKLSTTTKKLDDAEKKVQKSVESLGDGLKKAAASAVAVVTAYAGAPTAMSTLNNSVRLVAIQIGNFLLPTILSAAYAAQLVAAGLKNLSPEIKNS